MIDYFEFEEMETNYDKIIYSDAPSNVKTVSMLRHYINCHGLTQKLLAYFKTNEDLISDICEVGFGNLNVKDIIKNPALLDSCRESRKSKEEALQKNAQLAKQLQEKRADFCGIGTRKTKLFLNRKVKQGDKVAEMLRTALETEDENIKAKDNWYYAEAHYNRKKELIDKLITLCNDNKVVYGIQVANNRDTDYIIYFELPHCEQISFHNNFKTVEDLPLYEKEWDGKKNSTLPKIEQAILSCYGEEINDYYNKKK